MIRPQVKLGSLIILASIVVVAIFYYLMTLFEFLQVIVLRIIGPITLMAFFIGLFLLIAGLIKKPEIAQKE